MKKKSYPLYFLSLFIVSAFLLFWTKEELPSNPYINKQAQWEDVVTHAKKNLPQKGTLKQKSDGYVYLKVDDAYIYSLFPMLGLEKEHFRKPPYFRRPEAPGAHISVFYENENVGPVEEVGKKFTFSLQKIVVVHTPKKDAYAIINVYSPELEELRKKYGLNPKLQGHEFHITLAKKAYRKSYNY